MRLRCLIAALAIATIATACGDDGSGSNVGDSPVELSVFAASSLTGAFEGLGDAFENEHSGVSVSFNFLSSSDLAAQLEEGAPAEVFASADEANMDRVTAADLAEGEPEVFVHNRLEILVRAGNPEGIDSLSDLRAQDLVVSLCNEDCPAGRYALEAFEKAGVKVTPDSLEAEVKAVVTRVELGEADAGIVYVTDVTAAEGEVEGVPIPDRHNVTATYPIVPLAGAPPEAQRFVDFVLADEGQAILRTYGFLPA